MDIGSCGLLLIVIVIVCLFSSATATTVRPGTVIIDQFKSVKQNDQCDDHCSRRKNKSALMW